MLIILIKEESSFRNPKFGSIFIRHFIFAMESKAHTEQWSTIPSIMQSLLENYTAVITNEFGQKQKKKICYDHSGNLRPLFFSCKVNH